MTTQSAVIRALEQSWLLGWLSKGLAQTSARFEDSLRHSTLCRPVIRVLTRQETETPSHLMDILHGWIPGVGTCFLLISCAFFSSKVLGVIALSLGGICLVSALLTGRWAWLKQLHWFDVLAILWLASQALSAAFSSFQLESIQGLLKTITFLSGYVAFRTTLSQQPQWLVPWLLCGTALGAIEGLIGLIQSVGGVGPLATWVDPNTLPEHRLIRVFGTVPPYNPNLLAGFLLMMLGLGSALIGHVADLLRRLPKLWWLGGLLAVSLTLMKLGLVLTGSRGGYLALGAMAVVSYSAIGSLGMLDPELKERPWLKRLWLLMGLLLLFGVAGTLLTNEALQMRLLSIFSFWEDSSIAYRLKVYASAWQMGLHNWLVGIGPGNATFKQVYGFYMTPGFNALGAYSVPLEVFVEQGIIGLGVWLIFWLSVLLSGLRFWFSQGISWQGRLLGLGLLLGLLGTFMHGLYDTIWYRPAVHFPFWVMVTCWVLIIKDQQKSPSAL